MSKSERNISISEVKLAMLDERFQATLPEELQDDLKEFLENPNCACHHGLLMKVYRKARPQLQVYYPDRKVDEKSAERDAERIARNQWQVINCNVRELEAELKKLGPGRKQLDMTRWQDEVTVIVNHLEGLL